MTNPEGSKQEKLVCKEVKKDNISCSCITTTTSHCHGLTGTQITHRAPFVILGKASSKADCF